MNGVFSAIPYVCEVFVVLLAGPLADAIRAKCFSVTVTRKVFTCSCMEVMLWFLKRMVKWLN